MARPFAAYAALASLLIPTTFSLLLLIANSRGWHSSEHYADVVTKGKPTIAIVVQLLSHSLGLFQVCALCTVINLSFQRHASSTPFSLNSLRFVNSAFALRFDWNLPFHFFIPLVLFIIFSLVPAAVWSGAITPNVVSRNTTVPFSIPSVSTVTSSLDNPLFNGTEPSGTVCPWLTNDAVEGNEKVASFHNCISRLSLLTSASSSTSISAIPGKEDTKSQVHTKLDRSGYSFLGRSYGVGGTVGLASLPDVQNPLSHSFAQAGIEANVECIVNTSSQFRLEFRKNYDGILMYADVGNATLPEHLSANYDKNATSFRHFGAIPFDMFSWASAYSPRTRTTYFALAAVPDTCGDEKDCNHGYFFGELNQVQCQLAFTARDFRIDVDNARRTISVAPKGEIDWPTYADSLLEELAAEHNYISALDSAFGGSQLGHAIRSNVDILRAYRNQTTSNETTLLNAVEVFIADIMDNTLLTYSQSRYYGRKEQGVVTADVVRNVVVYGEAKFIYVAFALNLVVLVICVTEAVRTRFWNGLCNLDILDVASVAVSASFGGTRLAAHVQTKGLSEVLMPQKKVSAREVTGAVEVRLRNVDGTMCAIEPADEKFVEHLGTVEMNARGASEEGGVGKEGKYVVVSSSEIR